MKQNTGILVLLLMFSLGISEFVPDKDCIVDRVLEPNKTYYSYSKGYPNYYSERRHCRFTGRLPLKLISDLGSADIKVSCTDIDFEIPENCTANVSSITIVYKKLSDEMINGSRGHRMERKCGFGGIEGTYKTENIDIDWNNYGRGRYSCSVIAQYELNAYVPFRPPPDKPPPAPVCTCGWENVPKTKRNMVEGNEVGINQYPFMAAVVLYKPFNKPKFYCSASIISLRHALTAAHMFYRQFSGGKQFQLRVGEHNFKIEDETGQSKDYEILDMKPHNEWSEEEGGLYFNDIMLIKTTKIIEFGYGVGAVCLPFNAVHESYIGKQLKILGWGNHAQSSNAEYSDVLIEIRRTLTKDVYDPKDSHDIPIEQKRKVYYRMLSTINSTEENYEKRYGDCPGDDGSALIGKNITFDRYVLLGISNIPRCANVDYFVRVDRYLDWIIEHTKDTLVRCNY